ncbi:MAG: DUF5658 family protein [Candidatus Aquicultorales bacterium]
MNGSKGQETEGTSVGAFFNRFIASLQENDFTFALLLLLIVALNLVDFGFTSIALKAGYKEGNPLIDYLFKVDPGLAGLFKVGIATVFSGFCWLFRRHRAVVVGALFAAGIYSDLFIYHLVGNRLVVSG